MPVSGWVLAFIPHMQYNAMDRWGKERIADRAMAPGAARLPLPQADQVMGDRWRRGEVSQACWHRGQSGKLIDGASKPYAGENVLKVVDVEIIKRKVRKMAAGQVLGGGRADVYLDIAPVQGCRARIAAGYGPLSTTPETASQDSLIWILDGYVEVRDAGGQVNHVRQGESTVLRPGAAYQLVFPALTIYLRVEPEGAG